jgi:energy-coupling factor transport system ATP-binding protein
MEATQASLEPVERGGPPPQLSIERLVHRYANGRIVDLSVSLQVFPGQAVLITGPSGCGKSTFLRALAGFLPEGGDTTWVGQVEPNHSESNRPVLVLQDPESQLLCSTVEEEVGFGPHNLSIAKTEIALRVDDAIERAGIGHLRQRSVEALSCGEKYRVVLSAALAMRPSLLLLDEPFSQLDAAGREQLRTCIERQKAAGHTVIVTAHEWPRHDELWNSRVDLCVASLETALPRCSRRWRAEHSALRVSGLSSGPLQSISLDLKAGSTTLVMGDNGAGKSTLLRCLAGSIEHSGAIELDGTTLVRRDALIGRIGYLPQNSDLLLFEDTVERELAFGLSRVLSADERRARVAETLTAFGLEDSVVRQPLCLSHGERHRVALASLVAARPLVLLLDEPFTGLDRSSVIHVLSLLSHCAHELGMAVLIACHGSLPPEWADKRFQLRSGQLYEA